ncbi:MAG: DUF1577 domain-containing protein [Spirochaetales bacterium]|jgi:hypothetical protein|nr:DUF1577 domain-containing protein [Spirochaetales bacterium]
MGIEISRIEKEFILNSVCDKSIPLRFHGSKIQTHGFLKAVNDDYIILSGEPDLETLFPAGSKLTTYFSYFGHVMTFETEVRGIGDGDLKVDFPTGIHKNLARKYERVSAPHDVSISFEMQDMKISLNFPKTEEYDPVEVPEYSEEYNPNQINSLIETFREKVNSKVTTNTVTMFRERPPQGFQEHLVTQTGKIFFIPNTAGKIPENDFEMGGRIITRAMLLRPEKVSANEDVTQDRLPQLLAEKRAEGIKAEIYCPIIFHEYAVGFIYLAQKEGKDGVFDRDLLDETYQFSKVLAYALKINGYFKEQIPEKKRYEGDIIDISASGLLFANGSEQLAATLMLYADIDLNLSFGQRSMRIGARLMRKFEGSAMNYFGIQFMEIKPEDFRFLFDYVYGRSVSQEDEELWEGGAEPPKLDLS